MRSVLALVATARTETPEATEFLRVIVALCACAVPVEILEVGPGTGALSKDPVLTEEGERYLKGLASNGVVPAPATGLVARIDAATDVMRLVDAPDAATRPNEIVRWSAIRSLADAVERALGAPVFLRR